MHPEIRAFWEKIGVVDTDYVPSAPVSTKLWRVYPDGNDEYDSTKRTVYVAHKHSDSEEIVYYWDDKTYTEKEMLRIVKLQAFL